MGCPQLTATLEAAEVRAGKKPQIAAKTFQVLDAALVPLGCCSRDTRTYTHKHTPALYSLQHFFFVMMHGNNRSFFSISFRGVYQENHSVFLYSLGIFWRYFSPYFFSLFPSSISCISYGSHITFFFLYFFIFYCIISKWVCYLSHVCSLYCSVTPCRPLQPLLS